MKASKLGLLILILAFGSTVETAWRVRNHLGPGGWGWFVHNGRFDGPSFSFTAEQTETVAAATPVEIENTFGAVKVVQGAAGEVKVVLRKVVYLGTEEKARAYADRIQIQARREGEALRISTNRAELERVASAEPEVGFETHLDVVVPPGTPVKLANEHGRVEVSDVARADITSSFDSVRVERVAGPVEIQSRHGDVHVGNVKGDVKVTGRHGDVVVEDVDGRVTLDAQHGEVKASRTGGLVVSNTNGEVAVETVRGDLEAHAQHGSVRATDVTGRATVETTFDGATLEKVGGDASVHSEHGAVVLIDVRGAVEARATFDDVTLTRIGGPATVVVSHGGLHARDLEKGAQVRVSGDEVELEGFRGPVEVIAERSAVRLAPTGAILAAVKVTATHGAIELEIPAGSRIDVQATAERGEITTDVPGLNATEVGTGKLTASFGGGGSPVVLSTTHGDVHLRGASAVAQKTP
jgi:DUF4097 and DUF4098 domain-containing protein YvlB